MEAVKVAVRVRPLVKTELENGCRSCVERIPGEPQISIGKNNLMFTFNYVFDENEGQGRVYNHAVKNLIENLFKGYNLTILAYGQTGSGKTYTMGTNYDGCGELGVIPRAVYDIFETIGSRKEYDFRVSVSFLELYNEALFDLLTDKPREQSVVDMREVNNVISIPGLTEMPVESAEETLMTLKTGSEGRVVGSTAMNAASSRSHAVFTINIKIINKENPKEVMASKFHLVDLAGSERSKKTQATGDRFREGVNINKGLMVLGNVISQLCEGHTFINYRDSKLTRLLQDSLGGNSVTLMIACISPADYNQDESVSTLRYADRAKKIKNKPVVNQDPAMAEISRLRKENEELRLKIIGSGVTNSDCPPEHAQLSEELSIAQRKMIELANALDAALMHNQTMHERTILADKLEESVKEKLSVIDSMIQASESEGVDPVAIKDLREKILEIKADTMNCGLERVAIEKRNQKSDDGGVQAPPGSPSHHNYMISQAKLNQEIDTITKSIVWKEELMAKLCESVLNYGEIEKQESVEDLKKQIALLEKEKEELLGQMKDSTLSSISAQSKVSEQRRKRLQELEQKVTALSKKVCEQERIIKMKESSELKIRNLKQEILSGKQHRIRLVQMMKAEGDKFRSYKQEKDREVCLLRTQNMKKQNQLKKMEQMHNLQQNVLKRKLEAAAAANKRIMATLERQKAAKLKRLKNSLTDRIKDKLSEELELIESEYQAQKSLDCLIQERSQLAKQLSVVKASLEDPSISQEEKVKLHKDKEILEDASAMRSAEISDLQQKLLDIRQDDKTKDWDILTSMSDAKFAVSHVITLVSDRIKESINMSQQLAELKEQLQEQEAICEERKKKLDEYADYHETMIQRIEKESEEKLYVLLKRLTDNGNSEEFLSETQKIQLAALEKMDEMRERINQLESELKELKANPKKVAKSFQEAYENYVGLDKDSMPPPNSKKEKKVNLDQTFEMAEFDDALDTETDDDGADPDWTRTPLYKRIQNMKSKSCKCRGDCSRKICSCRKGEKLCEDTCLCSATSCRNKVKSDETEENDENFAPKRLRMSDDEASSDLVSLPRRKFALDDSLPPSE